jgi:hypothetical protein
MSCSLICNGFRAPSTARVSCAASDLQCTGRNHPRRINLAMLRGILGSGLHLTPAQRVSYSFLPATHDVWTAADLWARWGRNAGRFPRLVHGARDCASGGYRCSRLSTKSQHRSVIALGGLRHSWRRRAKTGLVRRPPAERLIWPPPVVPVEEFSETALLLKPLAAGRR